MQIKWNRHIVVLSGKKQGDSSYALKTFIESNFAPCDVIIVDHEGYLPTSLRRTKEIWRDICVKHMPKMLRYNSRNAFKADKLRIKENAKGKLVPEKIEKNDFRANRVCNIIKRFHPDAVICTEPQALELCIHARVKLDGKYKIIAEIPDFVLDSRFVRFETDYYLVENTEVKQNLIKYGINKDIILVSGLPTVGIKDVERQKIKKDLGIENDNPVVLVDGGEYNTMTIREDVVELMRNSIDSGFNLLISTGGEYKTRRWFMDLPEFATGAVLFNEKYDRDSVMAITDILVTVPDTQSIFIAFKYGVPVILTPALTIHEENISAFLVKRALVMPVKNCKETVCAVKELLLDGNRMHKFKVSGENYANMSICDTKNSVKTLKNIDDSRRLNAPSDNSN